MRVRRGGWWSVVLSVFVLVSQGKAWILRNNDDAGICRCPRDADGFHEALHLLGQPTLVPNMQSILSVRHVDNRNFARTVRHSNIRSVNRHHDGAHLRMDIAEEIANSGSIESHRIGRSRFIQSQVKALPIE